MSALDALRAAQERLRAELADPERIRERQAAGRRMAADHEWRRGVISPRAIGEAPRPRWNRDDDRLEDRRRRERR